MGGPSMYTVFGLDVTDLPIEEYERLVDATRASWKVILIP